METARTFPDPQARLLSHELSVAALALANALRLIDHREESVEQAREALEAFELLERGPSDFNVPRSVRLQVRASLELLREGRLELAHASLTRAGGAFRTRVAETERPRPWRH